MIDGTPKPKRDLSYLSKYQYKPGTSGNPGGIAAPPEKRAQKKLDQLRQKAAKVALRLAVLIQQIGEIEQQSTR